MGKIKGRFSKNSSNAAKDVEVSQPTKTVNEISSEIENQYPKGAIKNITIGNIVIGDKGPQKANTLVTLNEGTKRERTIRYYGGTDMELEIVKDENNKGDDEEER